ncbi:MAG TPA: hypothetical protein VKB88_41435 [Bryobacteraceae bacterium]|nr:hypothetical protein [Bryobacteraceae bacterium]
MPRSAPSFDLVQYLVKGGPRVRSQDPEIQVRRDVERAFYYIRPYVMVATEQGIERRQRRFPWDSSMR